MYYDVHLAKQKTWWWDEDRYGNWTFSAPNDEEARLLILLIVQRMNRKYWRMGEPRNVIIQSIQRLTESKNGVVVREEVDIHTIGVPLKGIKRIREALEAFFPKDENGKRFFSRMRDFHSYKPISCKQLS